MLYFYDYVPTQLMLEADSCLLGNGTLGHNHAAKHQTSELKFEADTRFK